MSDVNPNHEHHIFRLTLSFTAQQGTKIIVVSEDAKIVYVMDAEDHWVREFQSGEHKIHVQGYYDLDDNNIYLGKRVEGLDW